MTEEEDEDYIPPGYVVILDYTSFLAKETVQAPFLDLKFKVEYHKNLTHQETLEVVQKSNFYGKWRCNCYVLCVFGRCQNGGFFCRNDEFMKLENLIYYFHDIRMQSTQLAPNSGRIPKFFFLNHRPGANSDSIEPFYYFVRKCHIYICYTTYPIFWLLSSLGSVHRLQGNETVLSISKTLDNMLDNITDWRPKKFRLKPEEYLGLIRFDKLQFRHLLMKGFTNSIGGFEDEFALKVTDNDNPTDLVYEIKKENFLGRCLILNYKSIGSRNLRDLATNTDDIERMRIIFKNFEIELFNDLTAEGTDEILQEESEIDHSEMSCLVVCIMAECEDRALQNETNQTVFFTSNGKPYDSSKLMQFFHEANCPSLKGKPKIVFIQHWNSAIDELNYMIYCYRLAGGDTTYVNERNFEMPKDFLYFCSPKFETAQKPYDNSLLVDMIRQAMERFSDRYDFFTILHQVLLGVHFNSEHFYIDQMKNFYIKSTLTKLFFMKKTVTPKQKVLGYPLPSIKKCLLLNYLNGEEPALSSMANLVKSHFSALLYKVESHDKLTSDHTIELFQKESNLVIHRSYYLGVHQYYTSLVISIFAKRTKDGFECANGESVSLHKLISNFFLTEYFRINEYPVFIMLIDPTSKEEDNFKPFAFMSQTAHITISVCTYPDWWYMEQLCKQFDQSKYPPNRLLNMITLDSLEQTSESLQSTVDMDSHAKSDIDEVDGFDVNRNLRFARTILKLSTCTISDSATSLPKPVQPDSSNESQLQPTVKYPLPAHCIAKCIILSFPELKEMKLLQNIEQDVRTLEQTFLGLGFDSVDSYQNLTCQQVNDLIQKETVSLITSCLVLCLVTKCEEGYIHCLDGISPLDSLISMMKSDETVSLIPTILLIQDPYRSTVKNFIRKDSLEYLRVSQIKMPDDFLLIHSNNDISFSASDTKYLSSGSWFIQTLSQIITKHCHRYDLVTLLRMVLLACTRTNFIPDCNSVEHFPNVYFKCTFNRLLMFDRFDQTLAEKAKVNRTYQESGAPVKLITPKDALFYNNSSKGKLLLIKCEFDPAKPIYFQEDLDSIIQTFQSLNFDCEEKQVSDLLSFKGILQKESQRNYQEYCSLVVFILADANFEDVNRNQLIAHFTSHWTLVGKPKLFFLLGMKPSIHKGDSLQSEQGMFKTGTFKIPKFADFLLFASDQVLSTLRSLNSIFKSNAHKSDLLTMLSHSDLFQLDSEDTRSLPYLNSTLTRLVMLQHNDSTSPTEDDHFRLSSEAILRIPIQNRGRCMIFNYLQFKDDSHSKRDGTEKDCTALQHLFVQKLGFASEQVILHHDLSVAQTLEVLQREAQFDYSEFGCAVICFLSHGDDRGVLQCHDGAINKDELVHCLTGNTTLLDKPKLLFISACQGTTADPGILVTPEGDLAQPYDLPVYDHPNLFVFSSSYPGHYSYRDTEGTWFIQALCKKLSEHVHQYDLATIATIVNRTIAYISWDNNPDKIDNGSTTQISFFHSTLTKSVMFEM